jgi:hypothetical protein
MLTLFKGSAFCAFVKKSYKYSLNTVAKTINNNDLLTYFKLTKFLSCTYTCLFHYVTDPNTTCLKY